MLVAGHGMVWGGEVNNNGYGRFPYLAGRGKRVRLLGFTGFRSCWPRGKIPVAW